jgi:peptide/nickel transport system permease protein
MSVAVASPVRRSRRLTIPRFLRTPSGAIGMTLLILILLLAFLGPMFAPHSYTVPIGAPGQPPSAAAPLGTDVIGRDVLSRFLDGGRSVVELALLATLGIYAIGISVGLVAGYSRSLVDPILMRGVDLVLSMPAMLLLLLLVTGLGSGAPVSLLGVVLVLFPGVARIVRASTLQVSVRGYVEAAVARGERTSAVLTREVLPNIVSPIMADLGIRFSAAIIFLASLNYLGLGLQPPAADWALMISENRQIATTNIWAVLAPMIPLALLTIGVNLVADSYARSRGGNRG